MNILIAPGTYYTNQFITTLLKCDGITTHIWNFQQASIHKVLDYHKIELIIMDEKHYKPSISAVLKKEKIALILIGNDLPLNLIQINKPDVFCHKAPLNEVQLETLNSIKIATHHIKNSYNIARFPLCDNNSTRRFKKLFISELEGPQDLKNIYKEIIDDGIIVGPTKIDLPNYLGPCDDVNLNKLMENSEELLCYNGHYSYDGIMKGCKVKQAKNNKPHIKKHCTTFHELINIFKKLDNSSMVDILKSSLRTFL